MKKMNYIQPQIGMDDMQNDVELLTGSNTIDGDAENVIISPDDMGSGDGTDAASRRSIWDDSDF